MPREILQSVQRPYLKIIRRAVIWTADGIRREVYMDVREIHANDFELVLSIAIGSYSHSDFVWLCKLEPFGTFYGND